MVGYTLHNRFNTVIIGSSRALGNPITLYDCPRLLMGYDIPVPTPAAPRLAAAAAESAASARGAADAVAPVTVELVFKAAGKAGAGAPVKAAQAPAGSPVQPRRRGAAPARHA
ncbi:hypothetical protein MNEG_13007 [Monoraphidium neglectum]|uniref:Uncharacterized protein n=1 Tax=Monoraphidium neglectum TaxID=145388 RepID=A0A0D2LTH7_9CHLO|nr:hypothetical protein MNEG_13007 [Monoraphidium neglectum]KIY94954.1 hypothetical protein MNEG_13007 [Monoraphidium neglectum]|eukprot:XP_013893974.1 hypothetical protein MNEG_13007 [Monoraphidium neglectum]